jgi:hypothetical protein
MQEGTSGRLGLWICIPLLLWGAVWIAAFSMPRADCDGYGSDAGTQEALLAIFVAAASLGTAGAALFRLVSLGRAGAFSLQRDLTIGGIVVATQALAVATTTSRAYAAPIQVLAVVGLLLTGLALLALVVAWGIGLRADDVGLLLPFYLLGAAVLAYPLVGLLALASSSGVFC